MSPDAKVARRFWAAALIVGVVALVWVAFSVRVPEPLPPPAKPAGTGPVGIVDPVAIERSMLYDLTPLFLPTEYNSSRKDYVPSEPGSSFAGYPWRRVFGEPALDLRLPDAEPAPAGPAAALGDEPPGAPFIGFGRGDPRPGRLSPQGAYVEVVEAGSGRRVLAQPLEDAHPPSAAPWRPMEFLAAVDAAGLVGSLVPTARSGVAEVDDYFGRYLAETLRVGQRLAPGFYLVTVGP